MFIKKIRKAQSSGNLFVPKEIILTAEGVVVVQDTDSGEEMPLLQFLIAVLVPSTPNGDASNDWEIIEAAWKWEQMNVN